MLYVMLISVSLAYASSEHATAPTARIAGFVLAYRRNGAGESICLNVRRS